MQVEGVKLPTDVTEFLQQASGSNKGGTWCQVSETIGKVGHEIACSILAAYGVDRKTCDVMEKLDKSMGGKGAVKYLTCK